VFDGGTMPGIEDAVRPSLVALGKLTAPRIGIVVVTYNAVSTLAKVLDRIPADFRSRIEEVLVCDDASQDSTYLVGLGYKQVVTDLPLTVIRRLDCVLESTKAEDLTLTTAVMRYFAPGASDGVW